MLNNYIFSIRLETPNGQRYATEIPITGDLARMEISPEELGERLRYGVQEVMNRFFEEVGAHPPQDYWSEGTAQTLDQITRDTLTASPGRVFYSSNAPSITSWDVRDRT